MSWCTIESDPGLFTELISEIGVKGVQVEELYDLDNASMDRLKPIFGLVFLFKWRKETDPRPVLEEAPEGVFFAKQMIDNACATQAIINCLLNRPDIDVGPDLGAFREFTSALPAEMRGLALDEVKRVRTAHNSYARPEPFVVDEKRTSSSVDDDAFHFITYVWVGGNVYELDGLKQGPILLETCPESQWLERTAVHIQTRIQRYSQSEIRFNLMAIIKNRQEHYSQQLIETQTRKLLVEAKLASVRNGDSMEIADGLPSDEASLSELLQHLDTQCGIARDEIADEIEKFRKWKVENARRRFNYIPFIFNLLKTLAEKNQLMPLVEASSRKQSHEMNGGKS